VRSKCTRRFWKLHDALPPGQSLAKTVEWVWFGSHEDYNKLI